MSHKTSVTFADAAQILSAGFCSNPKTGNSYHLVKNRCTGRDDASFLGFSEDAQQASYLQARLNRQAPPQLLVYQQKGRLQFLGEHNCFGLTGVEFSPQRRNFALIPRDLDRIQPAFRRMPLLPSSAATAGGITISPYKSFSKFNR